MQIKHEHHPLDAFSEPQSARCERKSRVLSWLEKMQNHQVTFLLLEWKTKELEEPTDSKKERGGDKKKKIKKKKKIFARETNVQPIE